MGKVAWRVGGEKGYILGTRRRKVNLADFQRPVFRVTVAETPAADSGEEKVRECGEGREWERGGECRGVCRGPFLVEHVKEGVREHVRVRTIR